MKTDADLTADRPAAQPSTRIALTLALSAAALSVVMRIANPQLGLFNFTPIGALGLYAGARLRPWQAFGLPVLVMVVSDLLIWAIYDWPPFNPFAYGGFLIYAGIGRLLTNTSALGWIGGACAAGTVQFFLITNFGVWAGSTVDPASLPEGAGYVRAKEGSPYPVGTIRYARSARGLLACYVLGLGFAPEDMPVPVPFGFFGNLLAGDVLFTAALFGAHAWLTRGATRRRVVTG